MPKTMLCLSLVSIGLLLGVPCLADDLHTNLPFFAPVETPLTVESFTTDSVTLGHNGCIKGPFRVMHDDRLMYDLSADQYVGSGCAQLLAHKKEP